MTTWREARARLGRNDLPGALVDVWATLTVEDLRKAVAETWTAAEWPERNIDADGWLMLFDECGYMVDGEPADRDALPEVVTLYRGSTLDRRAGMSWTDDLATARWFAGRFTGTRMDTGTSVWRIEVPSTYVLARFVEGRGESEYVVDTSDFEPDEYEVHE